MVSKIHTVSFKGIHPESVTVEAVFLPGLPRFSIVGLADKSVSEAKDRIQGCFHAIGLALPPRRIMVNLAPADLQKEGTHYDLPIALALLMAMDILSIEDCANYVALGELSLDGKIKPAMGILPTALYASEKNLGIICPYENKGEAGWAGNINILSPLSIVDLINHFKGRTVLPHPDPQVFSADYDHFKFDMHDVKGQFTARRALEIAAAGGHNILMIGPPGVGKSMLAKRLLTILPPITAKEALQTTMIYSVSGLLDDKGLVTERPYREPHHSASLVALVGGGRYAKPGEISLANNGVLFLDELPEFSRMALESLRQPIEAGTINVARAESHVTYPARFQTIAAMNPCRCGHFGNEKKQCHRAPKCAQDYQTRLSGPLLDRFDIVVYMNNVKIESLNNHFEEDSRTIRERVMNARQKQKSRMSSDENYTNALLDGDSLNQHINLDDDLRQYLNMAAEKLDISARKYNRILRVARTIADLDDKDKIEKDHLIEALSYRLREIQISEF